MVPAGVTTAPGAVGFLCSGPATLPPSFPGACPPPKEEYWLVQAVGAISGGGVRCSTSYWSSYYMEWGEGGGGTESHKNWYIILFFCCFFACLSDNTSQTIGDVFFL